MSKISKKRVRWTSTLDKDLLDQMEALMQERRRETGRRGIRLNDLMEEAIACFLKKEGRMRQ